jgi:hypothetical protein
MAEEQDYFDLDLDTPKKKSSKSQNNQNQSLPKLQKIHLTKLQIAGLVFIVLALISLAHDKLHNKTSEKPVVEYGETIDNVKVELRDTKFSYSTDDFHSDTLQGRLDKEDELSQARYTVIDIDGGSDGLNSYIMALNRKIINDNSITIKYNDYTNMDDTKQVYQMKYYNSEYAVYDTYWWDTNKPDSVYLFSITIKYSGDASESLERYDTAMDKIIESIEMG